MLHVAAFEQPLIRQHKVLLNAPEGTALRPPRHHSAPLPRGPAAPPARRPALEACVSAGQYLGKVVKLSQCSPAHCISITVGRTYHHGFAPHT